MSKYVALQFIGLVRGFKDEKVRNNIYNKLIKPLENQGYEVHIFWHTYDIEFDDIIHNVDKNKFNIKKIQIDKDTEIQSFLENEFKLLNRYRFPPGWAKAANVDTGTGSIVKNTYHQFGWFKNLYSLKKATKLRHEYERNNNISYKWVIVTSGQMEPQNTIDNLNLLNNSYMYCPSYCTYGGLYNSFYLGNTEHLNYMGEFFDFMINNNFNNNYIDSEPVYGNYIKLKYKLSTSLNVRFHRVRYNGLIIDH